MSDEQNQAEPQSNEPTDGWEWARVEIMGHRCHYGRVREEERFGAKMLRVDIPIKGDPAANGWTTVYYGGPSIFSFGLIDEAAAMKANKPYQPPAISKWTDPDDEEEYP
jgi:hypothetical protein